MYQARRIFCDPARSVDRSQADVGHALGTAGDCWLWLLGGIVNSGPNAALPATMLVIGATLCVTKAVQTATAGGDYGDCGDYGG